MNDRESSARERVINQIRAEHQAYGAALATLVKLAEDIRDGLTPPDFLTLAGLLYYVDVFQERLHHPKEDDFLFKRLRLRTSKLDPVLDELQADHVQTARRTANLQQLLVHYQAGAPGGDRRFFEAVAGFSALLYDHMHKEEGVVLAAAPDYLTAEDWTAIAAAFEHPDDPLFGAKPHAEFAGLRSRLGNRLPTKLRRHLRG
jgi:hemerythrin-like domain-containing protein